MTTANTIITNISLEELVHTFLSRTFSEEVEGDYNIVTQQRIGNHFTLKKCVHIYLKTHPFKGHPKLMEEIILITKYIPFKTKENKFEVTINIYSWILNGHLRMGLVRDDIIYTPKEVYIDLDG